LFPTVGVIPPGGGIIGMLLLWVMPIIPSLTAISG
jgi:hypothetical protein